MRRAAKTDDNHASITDALRKMGWTVYSTAAVGHGYPDLTCSRGGHTVLVEIKSEKGKLTPDQERFHGSWRGLIYIIRSLKDLEKLA